MQNFRKPSFRFSKQYSTFKPVISKSKGLYISLKNYKYSTPKSSIPTLLQRCIASLNPALPLLTEKGVIEKGLHFIKITHYFNLKSCSLLCRENLWFGISFVLLVPNHKAIRIKKTLANGFFILLQFR